jgi:L-alanine-DL-glutamate epimerase-like enolase superfamily enzyme
MTTIVRIEVATARVPLARVTSLSSRVVRHRDYALVRVTGENGQHGIGFCYGGSNAGDLVRHAAEHLLAPVVIGRESTATEALWAEMYQEGLLHGRAGSAMRALSIIDIALWDLNARSAGLPLHRYLGARHETSVPAYASGGYYVDGKGNDGLAREMAGYIEQGFKAVKIKVGRHDHRTEAGRVAAARKAIGPDVPLLLDANNAWKDVPTAWAAMRACAVSDPYLIEEPFSPDDIESHAELARRLSFPVATGEIEAGRWRHLELLQKRAAMILQSDAAVCGGISEWRRIAALADGFGVAIAPHWFHDLHAPLVAATPNAMFVEFFTDDQVLNFRVLIDNQLQLGSDGRLALRTGPGLGFDFDEDQVARFAHRDGAGRPAVPWTVVEGS